MSAIPVVGSKIAEYTIQREIGEGGTSTVYQALHPAHGQVALKLLKERLRGDRTAIARFIREGELGTRVSHPNVVQTIEIGSTPAGVHYIALEWAAGELLTSYTRKNTPLPLQTVSSIIQQIADGVFAAHQVSIVHRDLKPDNIMYDSFTSRIKLLDFGIAADTQSTPEERLTRAGFFVGTLMYVAPEALSGALVGPAADQYSLATIAYHLLTGALPYSAKAPREMFTQLLTQSPMTLHQAASNLTFPPDLEKVVMKALSREPADRYPSVLDFATELSSALNRPVRASEYRPVFRLLDRFRPRS